MFIHFGMATWQGREYDNFSTDLARVNPYKINTDDWCKTAQSFGARQIVFVAKHVGGAKENRFLQRRHRIEDPAAGNEVGRRTPYPFVRCLSYNRYTRTV